jgi:hypothetical protein
LAPLQSMTRDGPLTSSSPRGVSLPFDASGIGKRPTPGLPHPAALRLQAFSTSWRLVPPETLPVLFHTGNVPGLLPSEVCSSHVAAVTSRYERPSWCFPRRTIFSWETRPTAELSWLVTRSGPRRPHLQGFELRVSPYIQIISCYGNDRSRSSLGFSSP